MKKLLTIAGLAAALAVATACQPEPPQGVKGSRVVRLADSSYASIDWCNKQFGVPKWDSVDPTQLNCHIVLVP